MKSGLHQDEDQALKSFLKTANHDLDEADSSLKNMAGFHLK